MMEWPYAFPAVFAKFPAGLPNIYTVEAIPSYEATPSPQEKPQSSTSRRAVSSDAVPGEVVPRSPRRAPRRSRILSLRENTNSVNGLIDLVPLNLRCKIFDEPRSLVPADTHRPTALNDSAFIPWHSLEYSIRS